MTNRIKEHIIDGKASLIEALGMINSLPGNAMTLFVKDDEDRIVATLTDGDIRRALLAGNSLDCRVGDIAHRDFKWLHEGDTDFALLKECRHIGVNALPVLDSEMRLTDIINLNATRTILPVSAILMAGGKGERLRPMTLDTPKPLLKIDGKAIIDYNVEALAACGIKDITVCTRYLAEKIFEHFEKPVAGVKVKCVREEQPLGTLGGASLVRRPSDQEATVVMNSDLLTSISFEDLYMHHVSEHADVTVAVIPYQVSVPYAIMTTEGNRVTGIEEKPAFSYYANAGIYMIANRLLDRLEPGAHIDATDFIQREVDNGGKVTFYPVNGTWIDVGSPVDFRQAEDIMRHYRSMSSNNRLTTD